MLTVITLSYYLIITTPPRIFRYQLFTRLTPGEPLNQETPFLYIKHIILITLQHLFISTPLFSCNFAEDLG